MTRRRLFVAAALEEPVRAACAATARALAGSGWPGRFTDPDGYHLTVAFLGAVDGESIPSVVSALHAATSALPPFRVPLDRVGAFPSAARPRVAWIGPSQPNRSFAACARTVRAALAPLGFRFDEHADAHVTLARADGRAPLPPDLEPPANLVAALEALTLYESFTERSGARYVPLAAFALAAPAATA